jgi:integrase
MELFRECRIGEIWGGDLRHYTLNLLAASTGMRMGEVQALQNRDYNQTYIAIERSWDRKYGLKKPKWNSQRMVPIPSKTSTCLAKVIDMSPFNDPGDFVFFGSTRDLPLSNEAILRTLYKAFKQIGISPEDRRERNITFHSWRHFYNSMMRGKVHDSKLRRLTGHRTDQMTEHYTHFQLEDFMDVVEIQEQYFSKISNHHF